MRTKNIIQIIVVIVLAAAAIIIIPKLLKKSSDEVSRTQLLTDLKMLAKQAQVHYRSTDEMGFSSRSFVGWYVPDQFLNYSAGSISGVVKDQEVILSANGTEVGMNGTSKIKIVTHVLPDSISTTILN